MGLDTVEFVIAIEEAFGITIEDADAESCTTPAKLTDLILSKFEKTDEKTCLSQRAFYRLRKAFRKALSVARKDFRPQAELEHLVPRDGRRTVWQDIGAATGARKWPKLIRPQWLVLLCIAVVAGLTVTAYVLGPRGVRLNRASKAQRRGEVMN